MYIDMIEVTDVDELCEIVGRTYIHDGDDYSMTYQQLDRGSAPSRYQCFASATRDRQGGPLADWSFQSTFEQYGNDMEIRGTAPRDSWGMLVPVGSVPIRVPNADVGLGHIYLMPPGCEMDIVSPAGLRFVDLHFDPIPLQRELPWLELDRAPRLGQAMTCPYAQIIAATVLELIEHREANGSEAEPDLSETRARLFDAISEIMADTRNGDPDPPLRLAARQRLARRARDYLEANVDRPVAMTEVLAETGGSRRALEVAFRERYGISPVAFHRLNRLTRVRRELKSGRPGEQTVSESAIQHGFSHFGRFAMDYKAQFHESPSETLARVAR